MTLNKLKSLINTPTCFLSENLRNLDLILTSKQKNKKHLQWADLFYYNINATNELSKLIINEQD